MTPQKQLQQLFREFNRRFFDDQLPPYHVKIIPPMKTRKLCGDIKKAKRVIRIVLVEDEQQMTRTLIHEMAHAASVLNHGPKFEAELERLVQVGAPFAQDELDCLRNDDRFPMRLTRDQVRIEVLEALGGNDSLTAKEFISWMSSERDMPFAAFDKRYWWVRRVFVEAKREAREYQKRCNALRDALMDGNGAEPTGDS
jgi:hypothetical protein